MYKIINDSIVQRLSDGLFIPQDKENVDWSEYCEWLEDGDHSAANNFNRGEVNQMASD